MEIIVSVVEDHPETREMLVELIRGWEGIYCPVCFEDAEKALKLLPEYNPDVVLMDIHLPGISGIECVKRLKPILPETEFIMCTLLEDSETVFDALKFGANGYLSKTSSPEKILEAIREVKNGGSPMSAGISRKITQYFQEKNRKNAELEKLTEREQEILTCLSKGYRYKEIAAQLFISIETVRKHIYNIYKKLQVSSRMDAVNKVF